ncbi:hypothetical protein C2G38_2045059 [Gigaspora rosea]|uniref:Uncharacterized protein n=1 Tax=Gigaspora rosea TaxID=44941 RepID=A0A397UN42_9GLOM|nr:hypothetical protein C2G38_2045059 [Gigaspora rosea]
MSYTYQTVLTNLLNATNRDIEITIPTYDPTVELRTQVSAAYMTMQQLIRQGKREQSLALAYFVGQLLEEMPTSNPERTLCKNILSIHYYTAVVRTYYIFKKWGTNQISRTTFLNLGMITKLKFADYKNLID